ncbi:MAG: hypothetical protein AABW89_01505 [Nanoarchaeota archaeon]
MNKLTKSEDYDKKDKSEDFLPVVSTESDLVKESVRFRKSH